LQVIPGVLSDQRAKRTSNTMRRFSICSHFLTRSIARQLGGMSARVRNELWSWNRAR
jgi:hypothetical protein